MTVDCLNSYLQVLDNDYIEELIVLDNNSNKDLKDFLNKCLTLYKKESEKYLDKGYCGDSYKTAWHIRNNYKEKCEIVTIPFHPGLSIIKKSIKSGLMFQKSKL